MLENFTTIFKKMGKKEQADKSKNAAKERLHLVLMQDRAHVSADFLEMMKQEIVDVIKKYIDVDENEMDVKLENKTNEDGTSGAPALYANIPIISINEEKKKESNEVAKMKKNEADEQEKKELEEKTAKKTNIKKTESKKETKANKKTVSSKKTATKATTKSNKKTTEKTASANKAGKKVEEKKKTVEG